MSENIYVLEESSSEYSTSSEDEEEEIIQNTEFMNNTNVTEYVSNRNNLFTKDIEKHSIMVDTKNTSNTQNYSYTFNLDGISTNNDTGGFGLYKNVIGFRLIKATIQNIHYTINEGNDTLKFTESGNTHSINLTKKLYDSEDDISTELQSQMNGVSGYSGATVAYDSNTLKYTISSTTNIELLFAQSTDAGSSIYRLLGFNNTDTSASTSHESDNIADASIHYVDLVVNIFCE